MGGGGGKKERTEGGEEKSKSGTPRNGFSFRPPNQKVSPPLASFHPPTLQGELPFSAKNENNCRKLPLYSTVVLDFFQAKKYNEKDSFRHHSLCIIFLAEKIVSFWFSGLLIRRGELTFFAEVLFFANTSFVFGKN